MYSCCCCKLFVLDLIMETPRGNQDYLFWSIDKCIKSTLHVRKNSLKSQYWLDIFPSQASLLVADLPSLPFLRGPHRSCQPHILRHSLPGLHNLFHPTIRDWSTWSKFGARGEHGDVFLFSNLVQVRSDLLHLLLFK